MGQFGDGEGGGDPCPKFLAHWRSKKGVQVVQIRGRGVEVIWTKSKRTATFFRETFPYSKCDVSAIKQHDKLRIGDWLRTIDGQQVKVKTYRLLFSHL